MIGFFNYTNISTEFKTNGSTASMLNVSSEVIVNTLLGFNATIYTKYYRHACVLVNLTGIIEKGLRPP